MGRPERPNDLMDPAWGRPKAEGLKPNS